MVPNFIEEKRIKDHLAYLTFGRKDYLKERMIKSWVKSIRQWFGGRLFRSESKSSARRDDMNKGFKYHQLSLTELSQLLATSLSTGLSEKEAASRLTLNGMNQLSIKSKNKFLQFFGYLFSGFCGLLWISALICLLGKYSRYFFKILIELD